MWVGVPGHSHLRATGENKAALAVFEEERDLAEQLEAEHPADAVRSVLGKTYHNMGLVIEKREEALTAYRKAVAIQVKLAEANPAVTEFQRDLANHHENIGSLLTHLGQPVEALQARQKALAIRQKLADANPTVTQFQLDLAGSHYSIAILLPKMGNPADALPPLRQALAIQQKVAGANPAVNAFQHVLAITHGMMGVLLSRTGKPEDALLAFDKALPILQELTDANPATSGFQIARAWVHNEFGRLLGRQKRFAESLTALDAGLAIWQKHYNATGLCDCYAYRGWALVRSGQASKGAADLRRAVELLAQDDDPEARFERSRALALLAGLGGDVKSGVTKDEARTLADQSIAALRDAISAGWGWPDDLKEPDFDPLRGRDDFKKLVAEAEAKSRPKEKPGS
jgi:tetratricopeptide (TPR) repeat protein